MARRGIVERYAQLQFGIPIISIEIRRKFQAADVKLGQGEDAHRAVDAAQVMEHVVAGNRQRFGDRIDLHFEVQPVLLADSRLLGNLPFDGREEVLAIAERLAVEPVVRAGVDGVETQEDAAAGPFLGDRELLGHGDGLIARKIEALLPPLAGNFDLLPLRRVERFCLEFLGGRWDDFPCAIQGHPEFAQVRRLAWEAADSGSARRVGRRAIQAFRNGCRSRPRSANRSSAADSSNRSSGS